MSKREGIFCDVQSTHCVFQGYGKPNIEKGEFCQAQATTKCALCDMDICQAHALHPTSGLRITVDLVGVSSQGTTSIGTPNWSDVKIGETVLHKISVCKECALGSYSSTASPQGGSRSEQLKKFAAQAVEDSVVAHLRGALLAQALDK